MMNVKAMVKAIVMMMMVMVSATCFAAEYDEAKIIKEGIENEVASLQALGVNDDMFVMGTVAAADTNNQLKLEADPMRSENVRMVKNTATGKVQYIDLFTEIKEEPTGYGKVTINGKRVG